MEIKIEHSKFSFHRLVDETPKTLISSGYLDMLQVSLFPQLFEDNTFFSFQQHRTPPHICPWIRRADNDDLPLCAWPYPDFTSYDFFLLVYIKKS